MKNFIYYNVLHCNTMETISVKFQEDVLKRIDTSICTHNFNSRTEFIREAVRDKLNELSKKELMEEFFRFRGKSKLKTTNKENKLIKKEVSEELIAEMDEKFK